MQELADRHGIAVPTNFTSSDPPPAILDIRAKSILKQGSVPVMGQFDATALDVARSLDVAAICDDVQTFLADVVTLAA